MDQERQYQEAADWCAFLRDAWERCTDLADSERMQVELMHAEAERLRLLDQLEDQDR